MELERELVRARSDLEHERTLAQERLATLTDCPGAAVGLVQGAERGRAQVEHRPAHRTQPSAAERRQGRGQGRPRQPPPGGRAARRAAEGTTRPGRRPAGGVRSGSARVARASRGAAPDARRDRREAEDRDRRARDRAAQAQRARAVGPDAAAQRGRARRHGEVLRLRRAVCRLPATRRRCDRTWSSISRAASTSSSTPRRRCKECSTRIRRATRRSASSTCAITRGCFAATSRLSPTRPTGRGSTRRPTSS